MACSVSSFMSLLKCHLINKASLDSLLKTTKLLSAYITYSLSLVYFYPQYLSPSLILYILLIYLYLCHPLKCKFHKGRDFWLLCLLLYPQHPEQCLAYIQQALKIYLNLWSVNFLWCITLLCLKFSDHSSESSRAMSCWLTEEILIYYKVRIV